MQITLVTPSLRICSIAFWADGALKLPVTGFTITSSAATGTPQAESRDVMGVSASGRATGSSSVKGSRRIPNFAGRRGQAATTAAAYRRSRPQIHSPMLANSSSTSIGYWYWYGAQRFRNLLSYGRVRTHHDRLVPTRHLGHVVSAVDLPVELRRKGLRHAAATRSSQRGVAHLVRLVARPGSTATRVAELEHDLATVELEAVVEKVRESVVLHSSCFRASVLRCRPRRG